MRISDWSSDVCSPDLHLENHPLRPAARLDEGLDQLQPLHQLLALRLGRGLAQLDAHPVALLLAVERLQHLAQRLGADAGLEIGRASCRERVCQYVMVRAVAV